MNKAERNKVLLIGGAGLAAIAAALYLKKKSNAPILIDNSCAAPVSPAVPVTPSPSPIVLNRNLLLKNGSKGNEVKELQRLMAIMADGIFGPQTEATLMAKKAVKQITLNQYASAPNVNPNPLKVGDKVYANKRPSVSVNKVLTKANGDMEDAGELYTTVNYGNEIGKIIAVSASKNNYVVEIENFFTLWIKTKVWVKAADVAKI